MTTKINLAILALATSILLVLPLYAASRAAGFFITVPRKLYTPALAQGSDPPPPAPIILTDERWEYPLGLHLEILEDPSSELTIEDVTSPEIDS